MTAAETVDQCVIWDAAEVGQEAPTLHGQVPCYESDPATGFICCRAQHSVDHQHVATAGDRNGPTRVVAVWPGEPT